MHQCLDAPLLLEHVLDAHERTLRGLGVAHRSIALRGAVQQFLFGHGVSLALRAVPLRGTLALRRSQGGLSAPPGRGGSKAAGL
jgi:hypothetical protein